MKEDNENVFEQQCELAATALEQADVVLVVTGAGFSADSGLPVYADVANIPAYQQRNLEYADVCQPKWVDQDPELFFGFWGQCFNDYRTTQPHHGYEIMARWRQDKNTTNYRSVANGIRARILENVESQKPFDDEETQRLTPYLATGKPAGAFYVFTSNADGHFYDHFEAEEIHDCHGSVELWQCSDRDCLSGIWRAPLEHMFVVDKCTMLAPMETTSGTVEGCLHVESNKSDIGKYNSSINAARIGQTKGSGTRTEPLRNMPPSKDTKGWRLDQGTNWPRCGHCGSFARPAILMFGDFGWKYDMSQSKRWDLWRETVVDLCREEAAKVCIVEIGCGLRVPTCRTTSEELVEDVVKNGGKATLVRINPDFPSAPEGSESEDHMISITSKGLAAIEQIDEHYRSLRATR